MLKREELAVIDRAIAELGSDSYLGPWLASVRAEVERDVSNDIEPRASVGEVRAREIAVHERDMKLIELERAIYQRECKVQSAEESCRMALARVDASREQARKALSWL